jgi:hypothetical protein
VDYDTCQGAFVILLDVVYGLPRSVEFNVGQLHVTLFSDDITYGTGKGYAACCSVRGEDGGGNRRDGVEREEGGGRRGKGKELE